MVCRRPLGHARRQGLRDAPPGLTASAAAVLAGGIDAPDGAAKAPGGLNRSRRERAGHGSRKPRKPRKGLGGATARRSPHVPLFREPWGTGLSP